MFEVLRKRNFALLWTGQLISLWGDWLLMIARPLFVLTLTGSLLDMGLMYTIQLLPGLLFGSLAGVFVDRWDRRKTMLICDIARALTLLLLLLVHTRDLLWLIYVTAFIQSSFSQFFMPAAGALTPRLVGEENLIAANSLQSFSDIITRLVGPILGGVLLKFVGFSSVVMADSATFLFSALMLTLINQPETVKATASIPKQSVQVKAIVQKVWLEWLAGIQILLKDRTLTGILSTLSIIMVAQGIMNALLVIFVTTIVHADQVGFGMLATVQGLGSLFGIVLLGSVSKVVRPVYMVVAATLIVGTGILIFTTYPFFLLVLVCLAVMGITIVGPNVALETIFQLHITDSFRGRANATLNTTLTLTTLIGTLLATTLGDSLGVRLMFNIVGILFLVASIPAFWLLKGATLTNQPAPEPPETENQVATL